MPEALEPRTLWELERVCLVTAGCPRLAEVSLAVVTGTTAVVGPSGSGKTSLLNVLAGFEAPTSGSLRVAPAPAEPAGRGLVCFWMPADGGLWPRWTAREQVTLVHPHPGAPARAEAERLLAALDLEAEADTRPSKLSHGQRQRVALARALSTRARVLLLDEPLVHVDALRAARARELLSDHVREHGTSLVFATHDPELLALAERVVCLEAGGVTFAGEVADLREKSDPAPRAPGAGVSWVRAALRLCVLVAALLVSACSEGIPALEPRAVRHHALPPLDLLNPAPRCIVPGEQGGWIVLDKCGRVLVLGADGALRRQWPMPEHSAGCAEGACLLRDGRVVVADTHYHRLVYFDHEGHVVAMVGSEGRGPGQFIYPVRVIQDPQGFVYVAEYGSNDRVQKLRPDGTFVLAFGSFGSGPGELQRPSGLAWSAGEVFVADAMNGRVVVYSDAGRFLRTLPEAGASLELPYDVAAGPDGLLWVVEYGGGCATAITREGKLEKRFGRPGRASGELSTPWSLSVGPGPTLWIADYGNRRIVEVVL